MHPSYEMHPKKSFWGREWAWGKKPWTFTRYKWSYMGLSFHEWGSNWLIPGKGHNGRLYIVLSESWMAKCLLYNGACYHGQSNSRQKHTSRFCLKIQWQTNIPDIKYQGLSRKGNTMHSIWMWATGHFSFMANEVKNYSRLSQKHVGRN